MHIPNGNQKCVLIGRLEPFRRQPHYRTGPRRYASVRNQIEVVNICGVRGKFMTLTMQAIRLRRE